MSFAEHRRTLMDSVFATFGEPARWSGIAASVTVRRREADDTVPTGFGSELILSGRILRVRASEVATPRIDDTVEILGDDGQPTGEVLRVVEQPRITRNRIWSMAFEPVEA